MRRAFLLLAVLAMASAAPAEERLTPPVVLTSVSPMSAPAAGGSYVTITGAGFIEPLRVLFDLDGLAAEALVVSATSTRIDILTPAVQFGPDEQTRVAKVIVESRGFRAEARDAFVFENLILQPKIMGLSPSAGTGGTRVTIFGEGFQMPVQVWFDDLAAPVFHVTRTQIQVEAPAVPELRAVAVTVQNINSGLRDTLADGFRYVPQPTITSVTPNHGPAGTEITILGEGFRAPLVVNVAGIAAQPLLVTGTKIVARTGPAPTCGSFTGSTYMVNAEDGSIARGPAFTYDAVPVEFTAVNPRVAVAGRTIDVQMAAEGDYYFLIGGVRAEVISRAGSTYRLRVPATLPFRAGVCTLRGVEGTGPVESRFYLHAVDRRGLCTATRRDTLTVAPPPSATCTLPPVATVLPRTCASRTVTISNERGRADLAITAPEGVEPRTAVIRGGETMQFALPARVALERLRFETNDPRRPWLLVCVSP